MLVNNLIADFVPDKPKTAEIKGVEEVSEDKEIVYNTGLSGIKDPVSQEEVKAVFEPVPVEEKEEVIVAEEKKVIEPAVEEKEQESAVDHAIGNWHKLFGVPPEDGRRIRNQEDINNALMMMSISQVPSLPEEDRVTIVKETITDFRRSYKPVDPDKITDEHNKRIDKRLYIILVAIISIVALLSGVTSFSVPLAP